MHDLAEIVVTDMYNIIYTHRPKASTVTLWRMRRGLL